MVDFKSENKKETVHEILVLTATVSSDGSGEPVQMRRLARAFAACIHKVRM